MTISESAVAVYPTYVGAEQAIKELQETSLAMFLMFAALGMYVMSNDLLMAPR